MLFALSLFPILREENVSLPVAKDKDPGIITISSCHTHNHQSQQRILLAPSSECTQRVATFSIYRWPLAPKSHLPPGFQQETLNWSLCFFPSPLQAVFGLGAKGYSKMRGSLCWLHFYYIKVTVKRCVLHTTPSFLLSVLIPILPSIQMSYLYSVVFLILPCRKSCSFTHTPSPHFANPFFLTKVHFIDQHLSMHPHSHIHDGYSHTLPGALNPQNCKCCSDHPQDGKWCPEHLFSKKGCKICTFKSTAQSPQGLMGSIFAIWAPTYLSTKTGWITHLPSGQWSYQSLRPCLLSNNQGRRILP